MYVCVCVFLSTVAGIVARLLLYAVGSAKSLIVGHAPCTVLPQSEVLAGSNCWSCLFPQNGLASITVKTRYNFYLYLHQPSLGIAILMKDCGRCEGRHSSERCPLKDSTCTKCHLQYFRCDSRWHRTNDCTDVLRGRLMPAFAKKQTRTINCPDWSCPVCLRSVNPVCDTCDNGHFAFSDCWQQMYFHNSFESGVSYPICRSIITRQPKP